MSHPMEYIFYYQEIIVAEILPGGAGSTAIPRHNMNTM